MKVAFIPPEGMTSRIFNGKFAMALAHLLLPEARDKSYWEVIRQYRKDSTNYLLLDNGAAEHSQVTNKELVTAARNYEAYETVLPDAMGNAEETQARVVKMVTTHAFGNRRYMAVVQGQTESELRKCVEVYSAFHFIKTIGIPRLLLDQFAQDIRIRFADWIVKEYRNRFDIHLLGTSPKWVKEAYFVAKYAPPVRSIDTSMPYNYAIQRLKLDEAAKNHISVSRPSDYFGTNWASRIDMALVQHNERVMKSWVEQASE